MNFYQRIYALITLAVIGLTVAVIRVCFDQPWSDLFITECTAILFGELVTGITFIMLCRTKDSMLPYSLAAGWISIVYLIFTLVMILPAAYDMRLKYFILTHAAGLTFAGIGYGFFIMGGHNIKAQEKFDAVRQQNRKNFSLQIQEIVNEMREVFPDQPVLLRESEKLADDLRFCASSRPGLENLDLEMEDQLLALRKTVDSANRTECGQQMKLLKRVYLRREEQAKTS